jgi:hypothetical protein
VAAQAIPLLVDVIQNPDSRQPGRSFLHIIIYTVLKHVQFKNRVIVKKKHAKTIYSLPYFEIKFGE